MDFHYHKNNMNNETKQMCKLCKGTGMIYQKVNPPPARGTGHVYHTGEKINILTVCPIEGCNNGYITLDIK